MQNVPFYHFQFLKNAPLNAIQIHFFFINQIQVGVEYIKFFEPLHSISDFLNKKI